MYAAEERPRGVLVVLHLSMCGEQMRRMCADGTGGDPHAPGFWHLGDADYFDIFFCFETLITFLTI